MEKEKSNTKIIYITIIVILLLFFFIFAYFNRDKILSRKNNEKKYEIVLIARNVIFKMNNNHWNVVKNSDNIRKNINWQPFKIYIDYDYFGEYNLVKSDGWYAFDNNRKPINMDSGNKSFFAYKSEQIIDVKNIDNSENNQFSETSNLLNDYNININKTPLINERVNIDLNDDGVDETIYNIANIFNEDYPDKNFTLFLVKRGDKLYRLYRASEEVDATNICFSSINSILDIDNDNEYEIIMSCTNTGLDSIKTILYKYNSEKDDYEIVISD